MIRPGSDKVKKWFTLQDSQRQVHLRIEPNIMECKQACLLEEDLPAGCQFETTFALDSAGWDLHKSWSFHFGGGVARTSYVL